MLSVVLTVWNEEANLPRALQSVIGLADEIVVVDAESTDKSIAIAKKFGCKIFRYKYTGIVEPARNYSISKATGDWVLLLDADEEVPPELAAYIKKAITNPGVDYYRLPRKNIIFGAWIKSDHWWPDYLCRLFKKGYIVWPDTIHGIPQTRGSGGDFPADVRYALVHHNYQTISQYLERLDLYTDFQLRELISKQVQFSWKLLVTKPFGEFLNQYFARRGYKEGIHGLVLSCLQAFSELVLYTKYWQYMGLKPEDVPIKTFNRTVRGQLAEYQWWLYEKQIADGSWLKRIYLKFRRKISVFLTRFI